MPALKGKFRYYPGDALVEFKQEELEKIAHQCGVTITLDDIKGKNFSTEGEIVFERTENEPLEEVTQTVIAISAPSEEAFRKSILKVIQIYRAPRTVYSAWGSDERAKEIFEEIANAWDGWF